MRKISFFIVILAISMPLSVLAEEIVLQPGPEDGVDVWMSSVWVPVSDDEYLKVGGWGDYYYSLLKFDIESLPENVASAKIHLYAITWSDYSPISMYLDRVTSSWDETTPWANRPSISNNSGIIPAPEPPNWYIIDITDLYNGWKSSAFLNFGIQLRPTNNSHTLSGFYSSDYMDDPSLRPKLVIVPYYSCIGFDPPLDTETVDVKNNKKVLPFKATVVDNQGNPITNINPPKLECIDMGNSASENAEPITDLLPAGKGTDGNQFEQTGDSFQFNVKLWNWAPSTYECYMIPGDGYDIDTTCSVFVEVQD